MTNKTSNLKIVQQQTEAEAQRNEKLRDQEKNWRLTQPEITSRARQVRVTLEMYHARLEGMPFDVFQGKRNVSGGYGKPSRRPSRYVYEMFKK